MVILISERIKELRESKFMTQSDLARRLSVSRASVNAWEMGISIPSIENIIELAHFFHVSTDYLFGIENRQSVDISSLNKEERDIIHRLIYYFDSIKESE